MNDPKHPRCPRCGDNAPQWISQTAKPNGFVTILWECTECGNTFETHFMKNTNIDTDSER